MKGDSFTLLLLHSQLEVKYSQSFLYIFLFFFKDKISRYFLKLQQLHFMNNLLKTLNHIENCVFTLGLAKYLFLKIIIKSFFFNSWASDLFYLSLEQMRLYISFLLERLNEALLTTLVHVKFESISLL